MRKLAIVSLVLIVFFFSFGIQAHADLDQAPLELIMPDETFLPPTSSSPFPEPAQLQSLLSDERFYNDKYDWSIVPPKGWSIDDADLENVMFSPPSTTISEVALFRVDAGRTDKTLSAFVDYLTSVSEDEFSIISRRIIQVSSYTCEELIWSTSFIGADSNTVEVRCKSFVFVENGIGYAAIYQGQLSNYDSYLPSVEQSIQTFSVDTANTADASSGLPMWLVGLIAAFVIVSVCILFIKAVAKPSQKSSQKERGSAIVGRRGEDDFGIGEKDFLKDEQPVTTDIILSDFEKSDPVRAPIKLSQAIETVRGTFPIVILLDSEFDQTRAFARNRLLDEMQETRGAKIMVFDGIITPEIVKIADEKGIKQIIARQISEEVQPPLKIKLYTF